MSHDAHDYGSTLTLAQAADALRSAERAIVISHAKPDGDAVGSTLACARTLLHLGASVEVWYTGPIPAWLNDFAKDTPRRTFAGGPNLHCVPDDGQPWPPNAGPGADPDLVLIVDTGSWPQLAELRPWIQPRSDRTLIIDHHVRGDTDIASRRIVDPSAASCTQTLSPILAAALDRSGAYDLPPDVAEPLYLGLATDTGWFRFASVAPETFRLAGDLIKAGVDHTRIYEIIEQQDEFARVLLLGRALVSARRHPLASGGFASIMRLTVHDFEQTRADRNDTGGFADKVLSVHDVRVSVVLTEQAVGPGEQPVTRVSSRSKPGPNAIDVNRAMSKLGGGGHVLAAGAKVKAPLDQAERLVLEAINTSLA